MHQAKCAKRDLCRGRERKRLMAVKPSPSLLLSNFMFEGEKSAVIKVLTNFKSSSRSSDAFL
jgi:hypothetical protein